jgi:serine protease Do
MAEDPVSRARRRRRGAGPRLAAVLLVSAVLAGAVAPAAAARWGWLGVRIRDLTEREMEDITLKQGLREGYGVVIADVLPDTPAAGSALKKDDVIVAIDGRPVVESRELQRIVGSAPAGRELTLIVLRPEGRRTVRVRVGPMPADVVAERVTAEFGFVVRDAGADEPSPRPVVGIVAEGSPAARGGLEVDDRILGLNGVDVLSLTDFRLRIQDAPLERSLRLRVERHGEPVGLELPPARPTLPVQ